MTKQACRVACVVGEVSTLLWYKVSLDFDTVTTQLHGSFTLLCVFGAYKFLLLLLLCKPHTEYTTQIMVQMSAITDSVLVFLNSSKLLIITSDLGRLFHILIAEGR